MLTALCQATFLFFPRPSNAPTKGSRSTNTAAAIVQVGKKENPELPLANGKSS